MASFWSFLVVFSVFMACFSAPAAAAIFTSHHQLHVQLSTISAAPAFLPADAPLPSSPSLSPDIEPLFPTDPGVKSPSPSELPTIPSSPSPPNPDDSLAPGPAGFSISPSGSLPASSSVSLTPNLPSCLGLLVFFLIQLSAGV